MKLIAFDLETAHIQDTERIKELEADVQRREVEWSPDAQCVEELAAAKKALEEAKRYHPEMGLGITCAGLDCHNPERDLGRWAWHYYEKVFGAHMTPAPRLSVDKARWLLVELLNYQVHGLTIVTWNGLFDWHVLGREAKALAVAQFACWNHVDLMLAFHGIKGYPLSLKAAAEACGSRKGTDDVASGADAPQMWADGEHDKVLEYVKQDATATMDIALHLLEHRQFTWISRKDRPQTFALPGSVQSLSDMTVKKVIGWPVPDQSWMTKPLKREELTAWLERSPH